MSEKRPGSSRQLVATILTSAVVATAFGFVAGYMAGNEQVGAALYASMPSVIRQALPEPSSGLSGSGLTAEQIRQLVKPAKTAEEKIVDVVKSASPAVVSIVGSKDMPVWEQYYDNPFQGNDFFSQFFGQNFGVPQYRQKGTEKQDVGAGTGFLVSSDGYIVTNRHVVYDTEADYTVIMGDGDERDATVVGRDSVYDIAVLKIEPAENETLPYIDLGDSDGLDVGETVLAIGYSLGEYQNSVSKGIVSGLRRDVTAYGNGQSEDLHQLIQTDAAINPGNSGGPLLNLDGEAIGVDVAMAQGAENVGFAIAINDVKTIIESVKANGKISRPFLGIRYLPITDTIKQKNQLPVDYGVLVVRGASQDELAVMPGSPADLAGLEENDIILEIDGEKIDNETPFTQIVAKYKVGDEIELKVLHKGSEKTVTVTLAERQDE